VGPLAQFLPFVGLLVLGGSIVAQLGLQDDPALIGSFMAVGLLSHLYTNVVSILLHLVRPDLAQPIDPIVQWLYWGASILGGCIQMGLLESSIA
jgi:hypothetical protein